jgi:hypothetical protein
MYAKMHCLTGRPPISFPRFIYLGSTGRIATHLLHVTFLPGHRLIPRPHPQHPLVHLHRPFVRLVELLAGDRGKLHPGRPWDLFERDRRFFSLLRE